MKKQLNQAGSALLTIIIVMPFMILISALYMQLTVTSYRLARGDQYRTYAQLAVDAGIDFAIQEVNLSTSWTGTLGQEDLHNDGKIKTTYEVSVVDNSSDSKTLVAIGRTFSPVADPTERAIITIHADLRPVSSGDFSIVTGVGGLFMSNNARILGGNVFVNGEVSLTNSAQIGLSNNPVSMSVAHQNCPNPPDATYPRVCNSGENGQPITLNLSSKIYGSVRANNQTNGASMSNPGLVASSGVAAQALPVHDRAAQKAAVTSTITATDASCNNGTLTWAGNLKITGDVSISNTCKVTINGNVWITGKLEVKNSAQIIVSDSLGSTRPNIMIDGESAKFSQNSVLKSNVNSSGIQIITYRSNTGCSPDCADVTGTDLYNSRNLTTIELDNSAAAPNSIFYARWSRVKVINSGQIGALVGQTVELTNSGTITFGTSVGTGTSFWIIDGYRRVF